MADILKQLNWIDLFVVIIVFRVAYISFRNGFVPELFKFLGTICSIYLALHYYTGLSDFLTERLSLKKVPLLSLDFYCFILFAVIGYLIFLALRETTSKFIKMEALPILNKWGALLLGISRGFLLASIVIFTLAVAPVDYLKQSVKDSYSGRRLSVLAIDTYSGIWDTVISKFMLRENFNNAVLQVQKDINS